MVVPNSNGQLRPKDSYCKHEFPTCHICLHSINTDHNGDIIAFTPESESHHKVEPLFDSGIKPVANLVGFRTGLGPAVEKADIKDRSVYPIETFDMNLDSNGMIAGLPYYYCKKCGLTYLAGGGPGRYKAHPSHINYDDHRYIIAIASPEQYKRSLNRIACKVSYIFGGTKSSENAVCEVQVDSDRGSAEWNLDNADIRALTGLLSHVEKYIIPKRKELVRDALNTNSSYFAGQAWRFRLIVITSLNPGILKLLLKAHKLKYSKKKSAFIESRLGFLTAKKYPASDERRAGISYFVDWVKHLAELGIQIQWRSIVPTADTVEARRAFLNQPPTLVSQHMRQMYRDQGRKGSSQSFDQNSSPTDTIGGDALEDVVDYHVAPSQVSIPQRLPDRPLSRIPLDYYFD